MSDLGLGPPWISDRGVERNPPLIGEKREDVRSRTRPPLGFGQGGGEEPALNRGQMGQCPISDLGNMLETA